jgi:hypothetical protein
MKGGIYQEGLFFTRPGELIWERKSLGVFFGISSDSLNVRKQ